MRFKALIFSILKGFFDALMGFYYIYHLDKVQQQVLTTKKNTEQKPSYLFPRNRTVKEPRLLQLILKCWGKNAYFLFFTVILFHFILMPGARIAISALIGEAWSEGIINIFEQMVNASWVLPLYISNRVINIIWFQQISSVSFKYSKGIRKSICSLSESVADILFSLVVVALFFIQAIACSWISVGIIADLLYTFHMCVLYSLYSFEYKWIQMGWSLKKRLYFVEKHWPYFFGFGLPLAIMTNCSGNGFLTGTIFAILFPVFIVSANVADGVQHECSARIPLFLLTAYVSNFICQKLVSVGMSSALGILDTVNNPDLNPVVDEHPQHQLQHEQQQQQQQQREQNEKQQCQPAESPNNVEQRILQQFYHSFRRHQLRASRPQDQPPRV